MRPRKHYAVTTALSANLCRMWALRIGRLALILALHATSGWAGVSPATVELTFDGSFTGKCQLVGPDGTVRGGTSQAASFSLVNRQPLPAKDWYWDWGIQAENYFFDGSPATPKRVQDYAGIFSVEYFRGGEKAAALTLRPGWYFEGPATMAAWDAVVDLAIGFPVAGPVNGVVGFSNGRFYHHALPIAGLIWNINPHTRLELVYPEPALVVTMGTSTSLRLGGELTGTGFLANSRPERTAAEYVSYRAGAEATKEMAPGVRLTLGAGVEIKRNFDFFAQDRLFHGSGARYASVSVIISR